jgi:hypothetical protein
MTTTKRAARSLAGWALESPIEREAAGAILGREIAPEAWQKIERAFERYGDCLDDLAATKASRKKDERSWPVRQEQTAKLLGSALTAAQRALDKHGQFMEEASENYFLANHGYSAPIEADARKMVDVACRHLLKALVLVERAESRDIAVPTAATARDDLLRDVAAALVADGAEVKASHGWGLDIAEGTPGIQDLTPFERLVWHLEIADDKRAPALAAWVRSILHGGKRGKK